MTADLISYHFTRSVFFRRDEAPQSGPRSRAIQPSIIITRLNSGSEPARLGGGQFQRPSCPASLLHVLMNQVIAHGAAPTSGHLGGPLVRADFGGGIAQARLQFRTYPLVGF